MSEEALAEREDTRMGNASGFANGDVAVDMDGHANGANGMNGISHKKVPSLCNQYLGIRLSLP